MVYKNNIRPVVCVIPENEDIEMGEGNEQEFAFLVEEFKKCNAVFLVHGFHHSLSRKGAPFFNFYKYGELLDLSNIDFSDFSMTIKKTEDLLNIKFSGYAPPAHMFDESFVNFVNYNETSVQPLINDLYGAGQYVYRGVRFIPLLSPFWIDGIFCRFISVHPKKDKKDQKFWRMISKAKCNLDPGFLFAYKNDKSFKSVDRISSFNLGYYTFKLKFSIKKLFRLISDAS
jgi:hypothetical protein